MHAKQAHDCPRGPKRNLPFQTYSNLIVAGDPTKCAPGNPTNSHDPLWPWRSKTELEKEEEDARKHTQLKKPNQTQEK